MKLLAQGTPIGNITGLGPLGEGIGVYLDAFDKFTLVLSATIGVLTVSAGLWFIFQIFAGAFQWLSSSGEKQALENARKRISNAIIGLLVVVLSYGLISIVGLIFGFNILSPYSSLIKIGFPSGGGPPPPPPPTCAPGVPC